MKKRLDVFLLEKGYYPTRNKAKLAIENGDIMINNVITNKVSLLVDDTFDVQILKNSIPYVSRGGLKLEKAIENFNIKVEGKNCLDIGASTGGFSDCLLKNDANIVYALDVGSNQLDDCLRNNKKVVVIENTNFRDIDTKIYKNYKLKIITADVSFISLTYLFYNVSQILESDGIFIALIKPQFETNKKEHNKNGLVNDKKIHFKVIENIINNANRHGLYLNKIDYSPIRGEKSGNIEYISLFSFNNKNINLNHVHDIIEMAFKELK